MLTQTCELVLWIGQRILRCALASATTAERFWYAAAASRRALRMTF